MVGRRGREQEKRGGGIAIVFMLLRKKEKRKKEKRKRGKEIFFLIKKRVSIIYLKVILYSKESPLQEVHYSTVHYRKSIIVQSIGQIRGYFFSGAPVWIAESFTRN